VRALGSVDRWINTNLGAVGAFVARKSVTVLFVSLTVSLLFCAGLLRLFDLIEDDAEKLWCVCFPVHLRGCRGMRSSESAKRVLDKHTSRHFLGAVVVSFYWPGVSQAD
jgi:hypothetical protein